MRTIGLFVLGALALSTSPAAAQRYYAREHIKAVQDEAAAAAAAAYKGQCTAFVPGVGGNYEGSYTNRQIMTTNLSDPECTDFKPRSMAWCKTQFKELGLCEVGKQTSGNYCFIYTYAYGRGAKAVPRTSPYVAYEAATCS